MCVLFVGLGRAGGGEGERIAFVLVCGVEGSAHFSEKGTRRQGEGDEWPGEGRVFWCRRCCCSCRRWNPQQRGREAERQSEREIERGWEGGEGERGAVGVVKRVEQV